MKIIGVIPARYESTRFPGKPLALINNRPMIWWVYQQCKKVSEFDAVYVATDDIRIFQSCKELGIEVIMTSKMHKTGTDRIGEVASKVIGDLYINIQGDEPLIAPEEIKELIDVFTDNDVYYASLRQRITDEEEIYATSTVKVVVDVNQDALYFSRSAIPSNKKTNACSKIYKHIGIYGYKRDFLYKFISLPQGELEQVESIEAIRAIENGYKIRVCETNYKSIGVDTPDHIALVENVMKKMK